MEYKFKTVFEGKLYPCHLDTGRNLILIDKFGAQVAVGRIKENPENSLPVMPVIQYTGKHDLFGEEVYWGHSLQFENAIGTVVWNKELACFELEYTSHLLGKFLISPSFKEVEKWKIIGHINVPKGNGVAS